MSCNTGGGVGSCSPDHPRTEIRWPPGVKWLEIVCILREEFSPSLHSTFGERSESRADSTHGQYKSLIDSFSKRSSGLLVRNRRSFEVCGNSFRCHDDMEAPISLLARSLKDGCFQKEPSIGDYIQPGAGCVPFWAFRRDGCRVLVMLHFADDLTTRHSGRTMVDLDDNPKPGL